VHNAPHFQHRAGHLRGLSENKVIDLC
jgi:hypothetical protein